MDPGELSRWLRAHSLLSPPSHTSASEPSTQPPGSLFPGLPTTPGGTFMPGVATAENRDLLSQSMYSHYMWPSPVLPHPDLLLQSSPLSSHRLPTSPLLLGDTYPPAAYLGHHASAPLPQDLILPGSWGASLTSPTGFNEISSSPTLKRRRAASPAPSTAKNCGVTSPTPKKDNASSPSAKRRSSVVSPGAKKANEKSPPLKKAGVTTPQTPYKAINRKKSSSASNLVKQHKTTPIKSVSSKNLETSRKSMPVSPKLDCKTKTRSPKLDHKPLLKPESLTPNKDIEIVKNFDKKENECFNEKDLKISLEQNNNTNEGNGHTSIKGDSYKEDNHNEIKIELKVDSSEEKGDKKLVSGNTVSVSESADVIINTLPTSTITTASAQKSNAGTSSEKQHSKALLLLSDRSVAAVKQAEIASEKKSGTFTCASSKGSAVCVLHNSSSSDVVVVDKASSDQCVEIVCKDTNRSNNTTATCVTKQQCEDSVSSKQKCASSLQLKCLKEDKNGLNSECHLDKLLTEVVEKQHESAVLNSSSSANVKEKEIEGNSSYNSKVSGDKSKLDSSVNGDKNCEKLVSATDIVEKSVVKNSDKLLSRVSGNEDKACDLDKQEDTDDTDIDVGEEVTSVSYRVSKVTNGNQEVKTIHATTFTPEISSPSHGSLSNKPWDVMDHHYDNAMDLRKSPMDISSASNSKSSLKTNMKKNDSKLGEGHLELMPSAEKGLPNLPASPNYMSFDPRILNFYTTEEREKLVQGGWIPSYYSSNISANFLSSSGQRTLDKTSPKDISLGDSLLRESTIANNDKKQLHNEKKVLSRDKKKGGSEGVCKKSSPPTATTSTIPIGIAIARKRHDEREAERPPEQTQPGRSDTATQDRVPPAVTTSSSGNLTSNLMVTGGSSGYWLGHGAYSLPSTRDGAQLQYNPPPGYKIAGDPITGQLYVIPDMGRGFGPTSPLPSPRSSIKSDQSLESTPLEQLTALSPQLTALSPQLTALSPQLTALSPQRLPTPTPPQQLPHTVIPQDYTRNLSRLAGELDRRPRSERPRSRDEGQGQSSRTDRPESRSGSEGQRSSSRSNQSTPTTVRRDLLSPERTQTPVTSPTGGQSSTYRQAIAAPGGYPYHYPYYPYYWGHPFTQSLSLPRAPTQTTTGSASITAGKSPTNNSSSGRTDSASTGNSNSNKTLKSSTSVQTSSNPVIEIGVQTCNNVVEASVQTVDHQQSNQIDDSIYDEQKQLSIHIDDADDNNTKALISTKCSCSCHHQQERPLEALNMDDIQTDSHDTSKESNLTSNDDRTSVSEANSDANSDGLQILSALASHIDFFSPLSISTDLLHTSSRSPDVSSVYNGPRSSYFDSNEVGQRRVKTPTSNFKGLDTMDASELEVRAKLAEIQWMYKEKQKELGKLRPKKDGDSRRSSKGSRRSSKSLSDYDPLSPKQESIVSPKPPMRKTKAMLKYMPSQQMLESPPFENKDSDVEELRSLFEDTFLETSREKVKERRLSFASKVVEFSDDKPPPQFTSQISSANIPGISLPHAVFTKAELKISTTSSHRNYRFINNKTTSIMKPPKSPPLNDGNNSPPPVKFERRKRKSGHANEQSPAKKRKPGRPRKFGNKGGVTHTLVSKSSKQFSIFNFDSDDNRLSSSDGDNKTEWDRRRSERIFLSDTNSPTKSIELAEKEKVCKERSRLNDLSHKLKKKYRSMDNTRSNKQNSGNKTSPSSKLDTDDLNVVKPQSNLVSCVIKQSDLVDGLRILYLMEGLFYEGRLKEIHPPDVYGISLNGERGNRPHILSREEVLQDVFLDARAHDSQELPIGTRICAYWSQQFSCMYPGLVVEGGIPLPKTARGRGLVNVEFDDGDTGKISVEHVRILPQEFPIQEDSDDECDSPAKRRKSISEELLADSWRERRPVKTDTASNFQVQKQFKKQQSSPASSPVKNKTSTPKKSNSISLGSTDKVSDNDSSSSSDSTDSENDSDDDDTSSKKGDGENKGGNKSPRRRSSSAGSQKGKGKKKEVKILPAHQIWEWLGGSSKRPGTKGKAKKTFYKAIKRGDETIKVGECAVFLTVGRPHLPYIGRVECFYESRGGTMIVKVKWFYHPEETKGGKKLAEIGGALYESPHSDENDVQTISHKCHVMSYTRYKSFRQGKSADAMENVYYLAGFYDPTASLIKFEGDVKLV